MLKSEPLAAATLREIQSHNFSNYVGNPPSIADGGRGRKVPRFPRCRVRIHAVSQFLDHLANDAIPALSSGSGIAADCRSFLR
jgi:hypothetical protein